MRINRGLKTINIVVPEAGVTAYKKIQEVEALQGFVYSGTIFCKGEYCATVEVDRESAKIFYDLDRIVEDVKENLRVYVFEVMGVDPFLEYFYFESRS